MRRPMPVQNVMILIFLSHMTIFKLDLLARGRFVHQGYYTLNKLLYSLRYWKRKGKCETNVIYISYVSIVLPVMNAQIAQIVLFNRREEAKYRRDPKIG